MNMINGVLNLPIIRDIVRIPIIGYLVAGAISILTILVVVGELREQTGKIADTAVWLKKIVTFPLRFVMRLARKLRHSQVEKNKDH